MHILFTLIGVEDVNLKGDCSSQIVVKYSYHFMWLYSYLYKIYINMIIIFQKGLASFYLNISSYAI